eukprot:superscaffoldBa00000622_g6137
MCNSQICPFLLVKKTSKRMLYDMLTKKKTSFLFFLYKELFEMRSKFVENVNRELIKQLLDDLLKAGVPYLVTEESIRSRVALLITNIEFTHLKNRYGAEKDEQNMENLLKELGYEVVKHRDLTGKVLSHVSVNL